MFVKFLIYVALLGLAAADVKHLSREYLPPAAEGATTTVNREYLPPNSQVLTKIAYEVPSLLQQNNVGEQQVVQFVQQDDIVDNDIELNSSKASTKDRSNDPAIANNPYGYNGLPGSYPGGGFPGAYPGSFPGQGFPGQGFPGQGFPGQGFPPSSGFINPGFPGQGFPGQGFPGQGFPGQGFPGQGFPGAGFPGQGFPGQGFPGQGFPGQGFPGQGFPGQGFPGQGFPGQGFPFFEQQKQEPKSETQDEKLLLRIASDTVYDNSNGGYLYNEPGKKF